MTAAPAPVPPASPCSNVCRIDPASGCCVGCWRTLDEIARWSSAGPAEQAAIVAALPGRRERWRELQRDCAPAAAARDRTEP